MVLSSDSPIPRSQIPSDDIRTFEGIWDISEKQNTKVITNNYLILIDELIIYVLFPY